MTSRRNQGKQEAAETPTQDAPETTTQEAPETTTQEAPETTTPAAPVQGLAEMAQAIAGAIKGDPKKTIAPSVVVKVGEVKKSETGLKCREDVLANGNTVRTFLFADAK